MHFIHIQNHFICPIYWWIMIRFSTLLKSFVSTHHRQLPNPTLSFVSIPGPTRFPRQPWRDWWTRPFCEWPKSQFPAHAYTYDTYIPTFSIYITQPTKMTYMHIVNDTAKKKTQYCFILPQPLTIYNLTNFREPLDPVAHSAPLENPEVMWVVLTLGYSSSSK